MTRQIQLTSRERNFTIVAALLTLFLGSLDALIMSAAMPTIVSDLGGLELYAWVYSSYFLSRAVSLPVFGKLADLYSSKKLFLFAISLFLLASIGAGLAHSMAFLVFCRVFQGVGCGASFALVYIVLSDVAPAKQRAKTLSLAASVWGISSVLGPSLGGFIVTYFSWRWIFLINVPIGILCLAGIGLFFKESRRKKKNISVDFLGLTVFSGFILTLLTIFITGGREVAWYSREMFLLCTATILLGCVFYFVERKATDPLLDLRFFRNRVFALGNAAIFLSSVTIFALFAYAPLYIQGALALSPTQVGLAMVSLSLGWSLGSFVLGRLPGEGGGKTGAIVGSVMLLSGSLLTLRFQLSTSMTECFFVFLIIGIGIGFVSLSTLILVQSSVSEENLGVVTSLHQFGRSLGATIGVGICGGLVTSRLFDSLEKALANIPAELLTQLRKGTEILLRPEFQDKIPLHVVDTVRNSVLTGIISVFWVSITASFLCLLCCLFLPKNGS